MTTEAVATKSNMTIVDKHKSTLRIRRDTFGTGVGIENLQYGRPRPPESRNHLEQQRIEVNKATELRKERPARENREWVLTPRGVRNLGKRPNHFSSQHDEKSRRKIIVWPLDHNGDAGCTGKKNELNHVASCRTAMFSYGRNVLECRGSPLSPFTLKARLSSLKAEGYP